MLRIKKKINWWEIQEKWNEYVKQERKKTSTKIKEKYKFEFKKKTSTKFKKKTIFQKKITELKKKCRKNLRNKIGW